MEICDFVLHRPATVAEACEMGLELGPGARFLAGGTEILPDLKQRRDATQHLIDLGRIAGLREIRAEGAHLRIGCLALLSAVAESPDVRRALPSLSRAILTMAALQIRNRATLGGNFCGGVPSADTPPICIAAGAQVKVAGVGGERLLPAEDFFLAPRKTALQPGELLLEVRIPNPPAGSGANYERFSLRRATALAVVGVAAMVSLEKGRIASGRVALGAVAPVPMLARECGRVLAGQAPSEELFERAGAAAAAEARPISDLRGSEEFRRDLVRVLVIRALRSATEAERGGGPAPRTGGKP
jgi:carbon-monoxide dehydrogenase medium subunit